MSNNRNSKVEYLSDEWIKKESTKHPGRYYYFNTRTGKSLWKFDDEDRNKDVKINRTIKESCADKLMKIKGAPGITKSKTPAQDRLKRLQTNLLLEQVKTVKNNFTSSVYTKSTFRKDAKNEKKNETEPVMKTEMAVASCSKKTENGYVNLQNSKRSPQLKEKFAQQTKREDLKEKIIAGNLKAIEKIKNGKIETIEKINLRKRSSESSNSSMLLKIPKLSIDALCNLPKLVIDKFSGTNNSNLQGNDKGTTKTGDINARGLCSVAPSLPNPIDSITISKNNSIFSKEYDKKQEVQNVNNTKDCKPSSSKNFHGRPILIARKPLSANERLQNLRSVLDAQRENIEKDQNNISSKVGFVATVMEQDSVNKCRDCSPMDWEEIDERINQQITEIRQEKEKDDSDDDGGVLGDLYSVVNHNLLRIKAETTRDDASVKGNCFYFIVDTNVFLRNLTFIEDLRKSKFCNTESSIIVVPYCVLQELDRLKMRSNDAISTLAVRAIKYLNQKLESSDSLIKGQNAVEANEHLISIENADDHILNCCLQVKAKTSKFLLLTNDVNLRNKALINKIPVSTKSDLESTENFHLT